MNLIEFNRQKIASLCKIHKVNRLFVFGSVLTPRFNSESDVDLVVDFKDVPLENYVDNYFSFKSALSDLLNRDIDLLEDGGIKNRMLRANIDRTKRLIYG